MNKIVTAIIVVAIVGIGLGWLLGNSRAKAQDAERPHLGPLVDVGTGFTYQGKLEQNNLPVNVNCDFEFHLFDAVTSGTQIGSVDAQSNLAVVDGLFTVTLNATNEFGSDAFNGPARWLEIRVKCPAGGAGFTVLEPRQLLTAAPYALGLVPGAQINNPSGSGLVIGNTSGHGLLVQNSGDDGVHVGLAGGDGVHVEDATGVGLRVSNAGTAGLVISSTDTDGIHIGSAGHEGVDVANAGRDGFEVDFAGEDGLHVGDAGDDGVHVEHAAGDGIFICATGSETICTPSDNNNGIEIVNPEHYGVYVISAGSAGVRVASTSGDGVVAGGDFHGVHGSTTSAKNEWGLYTLDKLFVGTSLTTNALTLMAQVTGPDALQPGDLVAAVGITDPLIGSSAPLALVQRAGGSNFGNVIGVVEGRMKITLHPGREESDREEVDWGSAPGPAHEGDYIALTVLGVAEVRIDSSATIQPGQRLTASDVAGTARPLRTESLNGMIVNEGTPVIGIALATPESGKDTIPVFVTLR